MSLMSGSSSQQILRFLSRLVLIAFIVFLCDRGIGKVLKYFYFRQSSGLLYRTTYAIDSTKADILVFGSSRANRHYVPAIFEDSLHCTFYNTGREGNFILYNYAIFKAVTRRYQPKLIIIDIIPGETGYESKSYERLSSLLPYYQNHAEIRSIVALRSPLEKIKLLSAIYPYNSLLFTIAMGNLEYNKKRKADIKGYLPLHKTMKPVKMDTVQLDDSVLDGNKINALTQIMNTCRQNKIELWFVQSPAYLVSRDKYLNPQISELFSGDRVNYYNLSDDTLIINNPEYFADKNHLNDKGARVFSNLVSKRIHETRR
jgi:hypothetical protein